jgi:glycosyltransferase involved in cell wall biosynthesis
MTPLPLRILHVVPYYEQAWAYGGIPRLATTMTRALARRGHHVTVYTTDARDADTRAASATAPHQGVEVRMFPNVSNALAYHLQFFTPIGLRARLKDTAPTFDIAHLHACHNLPGVIAAAELSRAGVPYVVSPNGTARPIERRVATKRLVALTLGRRMLAEASRVVAVSRAEAAQLGTLGVDAKSIAFIPNPIDEHEFERIPDGAQFRATLGVGRRPLLLFLGKLTPRKGVDHLVRAFSALDRSDAVLVVAGNDMGAGPAVDALVRRLNLERRVIRPGLLTGSDRLDALAAANVVAYPSRDEIFGLVPLEALLCGTPVVVCDDSGCAEVIRATGGGLVVPHGNPQTLSEAMASILMNERPWRRRAVAAGIVARRLFGTDIVCGQLESLYSSVLADSVNDRRLPA